MPFFWFRKYASPVLFVLLVCLLVFLSGCGTKHRWYKPDHYQADFDKDALECETIAREMARQATMTGKSEDPATFISSFNNCLSKKGWSNAPQTIQKLPEQEKSAPLAVLEQGKVQGFGKAIQMPQGFTLLAESSQVAGPFTAQNFQWTGGDSTFIQIVFQKTTAQSFDPIDYVVAEPFFLYERGKDEKKPDLLRWAVFAGEIKKNWVVGLGSYVLVNKNERIIVVVTRPLPNPEASPPPGLRLNKEQRDAAELFMKEWLGRLIAGLARQ